MERVLASKNFKRSRRLSGFLTYICDQTLSGKPGEINEHLIGERVFGRRHDYDTGVDNIVRVEARDLRRRLAAYFNEEGKSEPVVIRVPRGGYTPVFENRDAASSGEKTAPPDSLSTGAAAPGQRLRRLVFALSALSTVLAIALGFALVRIAKPVAAPSSVAAEEPFARFWGHIFEPDTRTIFCVADSNFALLQDLRNESAAFTDYQSGRYFSERLNPDSSTETERLMAIIAARRHTSVAAVSILSRILWLNRPATQLLVRSARELGITDLRGQNAILTGSPRSNPWTGLFDERRIFSIQYDVGGAIPFVINRNPAAGEKTEYPADPVDESAYKAYGTVAFMANLDRTGHVLLIAGTNMQGTEAAADLVMSPMRFSEVLERLELGVGEDEEFPEFEVLIELVTVGGSSISTEIVAVRRIPGAESSRANDRAVDAGGER